MIFECLNHVQSLANKASIFSLIGTGLLNLFQHDVIVGQKTSSLKPIFNLGVFLHPMCTLSTLLNIHDYQIVSMWELFSPLHTKINHEHINYV